MAKHGSKRARRNYIINAGFQIRFGLTIFVAMFVIGTIAVWTTYVTTYEEFSRQLASPEFSQRIEQVYVLAQADAPESRQQRVNTLVALKFTEVFNQVSLILLLRLVIIGVLMFLVAMVAAHKIAGPLYRLKKAAIAMESGNLTIDLSSLREGDEMQDLATALHNAIASVRSVIERYKLLTEQLTALVGQLSAQHAVDAASSEQFQHIKEELREISGRLKEEIEFFKTTQTTIAVEPDSGSAA